MKIGLMTFHWASNHGAIIQAYCLQQYLEKNLGAEVDVIDYYPDRFLPTLKRALSPSYPKVMLSRVIDFKKDRLLKLFRNERLHLTKHYASTESLTELNSAYDCIICGSDQIWNPAFTSDGERKLTTAYYLSFYEHGKKIAFSVSFGCSEYPPDIFSRIKDLVCDFDAVGVRENTGKELLEREIPNFRATVTCDPTMLIERDELLSLFTPVVSSKKQISVYTLRDGKKPARAFAKACVSKMNDFVKIKQLEFTSMEEWLSSIKTSRLVITNSFHGMMMCLRLHTDFGIILEKKIVGMNDRFFTVLKELNLMDHIIDEKDMSNPSRILQMEVDWEAVDKVIAQKTKQSTQFLIDGLAGI